MDALSGRCLRRSFLKITADGVFERDSQGVFTRVRTAASRKISLYG
jgi:hypothetical protein